MRGETAAIAELDLCDRIGKLRLHKLQAGALHTAVEGSEPSAPTITTAVQSIPAAGAGTHRCLPVAQWVTYRLPF
jgi:hypothetical protein